MTYEGGQVLAAATTAAAVLPATFGTRWTVLSAATVVVAGAVLAGLLTSTLYKRAARLS